MNPIDHILDRARARRKRYKHTYQKRLPDLSELHETTILGSYSMLKLESSQRLLKEDSCLDIGEGMGETPSAIARDYLTGKYGRGAILKHEQIVEVRTGTNPMPLFAIPYRFDRGYYIDLKSCYWTLMGIVGWNVDYWPARWLQPGDPPTDFPFADDKLSRNCLVTAGTMAESVRWNPDKGLEQIKLGNHLANTQLYRLINDILNTIADKIRACGVVYINTDGYIAPNLRSLGMVAKHLQSWGLPFRVKAEGSGEVFGAGSYRVGRLRSRRVMTPAPINNVYPLDYGDWLQERISRLARLHGTR